MAKRNSKWPFCYFTTSLLLATSESGGSIGKQHKKHRPIKRFYQVNDYIRAEKLRVVDEHAKQIGVMSKAEALQQARQAGLDLVEVAPNANPPVAKIIDFAKFKYQEKQKYEQGAKKSKAQNIKEIRFTPFIAEHDYNTRINKAQEFLEANDKVILIVKFVGRQLTRTEFGVSLLNRAISALSEFSTVEREPALKGRLLSTTLNPIKKRKSPVIDN